MGKLYNISDWREAMQLRRDIEATETEGVKQIRRNMKSWTQKQKRIQKDMERSDEKIKPR